MFKLLRNLDQRELIGIAQNWHKQALWRIGSDTYMVGTLIDDLAPLFIEAGVENGELFEQRRQQLDQQGHIGKTNAAPFRHRLERLPQSYKLGAIKFIEGR